MDRIVPVILLLGCVAAPSVAAHSAAPPELAGAEWVVEDIAGRRVADRSRATIAFSDDGRVAGTGSCNRYTGGYILHGKDLSFTPLAATRMACEPALMTQEQDFFGILAAVVRYDIDATGALRLLTADGRVVRARR